MVTGGKVYDVLRKRSATNYDTTWGAAVPTTYLTKGTDQAIGTSTSTNTTLNFTGGSVSSPMSGTSTITTGAAGIWRVHLHVNWNNGTDTATTTGRKIAVIAGGTEYYHWNVASYGGLQSMDMTWTGFLGASSTISGAVMTNSGTGKTVLGNSHMSISYLGG